VATQLAFVLCDVTHGWLVCLAWRRVVFRHRGRHAHKKRKKHKRKKRRRGKEKKTSDDEETDDDGSDANVSQLASFESEASPRAWL